MDMHEQFKDWMSKDVQARLDAEIMAETIFLEGQWRDTPEWKKSLVGQVERWKQCSNNINLC